ncbi:hypothetical protein ABL78_0022 [Leptomonas seymouri]|uniref:tRNA/rRNA methyltransferase SpoU type domain-containing protein n=1 Tax=Leptomonas seymouri TaxID=5684 RepID=A0A0N0P977_LEPSE|nr:hypothetical protein ABL78_0022 [Leptomonas seymouri]|eukprot:KPI90789.1 hypothetical protein ABL78_0022 [Leptomonas seymouri]
MQRTLQLLKQTIRPPRRTIPLAENPLTRWSRQIPQWRQLSGVLTPAEVGLEGCHCAFNATNSIRTCLYFQTAAPPTFLTAESWRSIDHVQTRSSSHGSTAASSLPSSCATSAAESNTADACPFEGIAYFGEEGFFACHATEAGRESRGVRRPIVAVENFTARAQSLLQTRLPLALGDTTIRLVMGHENWGVRRSLLRTRDSTPNAAKNAELPVADMVVYVPQHGTISSLNVVTSLGIALFYCYMDEVCPYSRTIYPLTARNVNRKAYSTLSSDATSNMKELEALRDQIQSFQDYFKANLPTPPPSPPLSDDAGAENPAPTSAAVSSQEVHVNTTPRVDRRPIHPVFYRQEMSHIQQLLRDYRRMLLQYSHGRVWASEECPADAAKGGAPACTSAGNGSATAAATPLTPPSFFGISVLYENEYDQRNFGGLIRNANAFLVDHIFYVGRRKYNVVGAVGSYHYTPPVYLGPLPRVHREAGAFPAKEPASSTDPAVAYRGDGDATAMEGSWTTLLKAKVDALYLGKGASAPPQEWWLLDCGHRFLYEEDTAATTAEYSTERSGRVGFAFARHSEVNALGSLEVYNTLISQGRVYSLCETEAALRNVLSGGVVLIVPQEGKLPHAELMRLCTGVLTVLPNGSHFAAFTAAVGNTSADPSVSTCHRGLPSQVASGIALQRLSAVLHPRLAAM